MAQKIYMPMTHVGISQKEKGNFSHQGINAIDLWGHTYGKSYAYAPVDMKVIKTYAYNSMGYAVIFRSVSKVKFADGDIDYAIFMFMHINPSDYKKIGYKVGKKFKQGQLCYKEGTSGFATGNHIHLEVAKGKNYSVASNGWSVKGNLNSQKAYYLNEKHKIMGLLGNKYKIAKTSSNSNTGGIKTVKLKAMPWDKGRVNLKAKRRAYKSIPTSKKAADKYALIIEPNGPNDFDGLYKHANYKGRDHLNRKVTFTRVSYGGVNYYMALYNSDNVIIYNKTKPKLDL